MTYEEAIRDIKENIKPVVGGISLDMAIEALEKQSNIVHCKDCQNWKTITIETLDGRNTEAGQCELTKWLCGGQGYCMYGKEVE